MCRILALIITLLAAPMSAHAAEEPLSIQIEPDKLDTINYHKPFRVIITNAGNKPIHVWTDETRKGLFQLSFQFINIRTREKFDVRYSAPEGEEVPTYNSYFKTPSVTDTIAPKDTLDIQIRFESYAPISHGWMGLPAPNGPDRFRVKAMFVSKGGHHTDGQAIWAGHLESQELTINWVAPQMKKPQDYLLHGFSARAIEIMKADPSWIKMDDARIKTPLLSAVKHGCLDAVLWLLNAGADVNGGQNNEYTPLHAADDKEVVALLLQKKPDLNRKYQGQTPLQIAARHSTDGRTAAAKKKWREMAAMYLKAGADYDFHSAIYMDDFERFKAILTKSPRFSEEVNFVNPLRLAASLGRLEMCRYLIDTFHADVNDFGQMGNYPILVEALAYPKIVKMLIDHKADLKRPINWPGGSSGPMIIGSDATALHHAADHGVPETVTLLIDAGVDVFALARTGDNDEPNQTALQVAALSGKAENALAILKHPRFKAGDDKTRQAVLNQCLIDAAYASSLDDKANRPELVRALLAHGADPFAKVDNRTALQAAIASMHPGNYPENEVAVKIVAQLRQKGVRLTLFDAVAIGDEAEAITLLKLNPKSANDRRSDGFPILSYAVAMNHKTIVAAMLQAGADIHIRNQADNMGSGNDTPLHSAAFWGHLEMVKLLLDAGADVGARNAHGMTVLHDATNQHNRDHLKIVELLLQKGADPQARDKENKAPLDWRRVDTDYNFTAMEKLFEKYQKKN